MAFRLGLNDAYGLPIHVKQIVGITAFKRELAHGYTQSRRDVHFGEVLDKPTTPFQLAVDILPGFLLGSHLTTRLLHRNEKAFRISILHAPCRNCKSLLLKSISKGIQFEARAGHPRNNSLGRVICSSASLVNKTLLCQNNSTFTELD
jgi:hypothetical protein